MIDHQSSLVEYARQDLVHLVFWTVLFMFLGWLVGYTWTGVLVGIGIFTFRQTRSLYQLYNWLRFSPEKPAPELHGVWDGLAYNFQRIQVKQNKAKNELKLVIERAQGAVFALTEAIVLIDAHDQLEWWNPSAEVLLGLKKGDRGRNIKNLMRTPEFLAYYNAPNNDQLVNMASWVKSGQYLQCKITRLGDDEKLLIASDITRLHHLEEMRKDFVANVSHELRTPLTVVMGYLETIQDLPLNNPRLEKAHHEMYAQSKRMNLLINDLLLLSQLESGGFVLKEQSINVAVFLEELLEEYAPYNLERQHTLSLVIESDLRLLGSRKELKSAFSNLFVNAIKYTPEGGKITLRWFTNAQGGYLSVSDNGLGIESRHLPRLTERFYRVDRGRSLDTGGTGLGLAIVKHVLQQHDARLDITSVPSKGSVFTCVFQVNRLLPAEDEK